MAIVAGLSLILLALTVVIAFAVNLFGHSSYTVPELTRSGSGMESPSLGVEPIEIRPLSEFTIGSHMFQSADYVKSIPIGHLISSCPYSWKPDTNAIFRPIAVNPQFEIQNGHHRVQAARCLGLKTIPYKISESND